MKSFFPIRRSSKKWCTQMSIQWKTRRAYKGKNSNDIVETKGQSKTGFTYQSMFCFVSRSIRHGLYVGMEALPCVMCSSTSTTVPTWPQYWPSQPWALKGKKTPHLFLASTQHWNSTEARDGTSGYNCEKESTYVSLLKKVKLILVKR